MRAGPCAVLFLGLLMVPLLAGCAAPDAGKEVVVDVVASRYAYVPANVTAHVGDTLVFRIRSEDVTHGFAIEGIHAGVEIPPGETVEVRVKVTSAGTFTIYCTVFCGTGHPGHKGTLTVLAP